MSKMKKILSVIVLAILLVVAVGCDKKPAKGDLVSVRVIVQSSEEELSNKTHEVEEFTSVFELMESFYTITYTRSSFGPFLNTIKIASKTIAKEGYYIAFYINDEYASVGIGSYYVKKDDTIKFVEEQQNW